MFEVVIIVSVYAGMVGMLGSVYLAVINLTE